VLLSSGCNLSLSDSAAWRTALEAVRLGLCSGSPQLSMSQLYVVVYLLACCGHLGVGHQLVLQVLGHSKAMPFGKLQARPMAGTIYPKLF
jgi:hypothetical protein